MVDITWVAALGAPVLCFDTCTVLDLMRDPTRPSIRVHEQYAALDLLGAMEGNTALVALMAHQVEIEIQEHICKIEAEAAQALKKLCDQIKQLEAAAAAYGRTGQADLSHLDDYVPRSRIIVDRWIKAAKQAEQGTNIPSQALIRLNMARTPAKKGKDSMKDCVVIETYLDIAGRLRAAGLLSKIVYVSSNTKDYAEGPGVELKPDLAQEFAGLGVEYAPNLAAAKHQLGL